MLNITDEQINLALDEMIVIGRWGDLATWIDGLSPQGKLLAAHATNRLVTGVLAHLADVENIEADPQSLKQQVLLWVPKLIEVVKIPWSDHYSFMQEVYKLLRATTTTDTSQNSEKSG